ncbi:hypothetical protein GDO86_018839 [Hymenochirus boettgeri]|nr:hypothetical protein GDO86_018839 [Hymenochirus boettgeri]KAG8432093.1 hypothetical protein GDO86_018839 [Hymenochirus boettgeri]
MVDVSTADDLDDELTCQLCLDIFNDPVMIECGHNFCRACIDKARSGRDSFICPECKKTITDCTYTTNHALVRLMMIAGFTLVRPVKNKIQLPEMCLEHEERLILYCKDDGMLACVICRDSLKHANHNLLHISDAVDLYKPVVAALVAPFEDLLKEAEPHSKKQREEIDLQKNKIAHTREYITSQFDMLRSFLREQEKNMMDQMKNEEEEFVKEMGHRLAHMQENQKGMIKSIHMAKEKMGEADSRFLMDMKDLIDKCQQQQEEVSASEKYRPSKELCQAIFKGPIQYMMWKELGTIACSEYITNAQLLDSTFWSTYS